MTCPHLWTPSLEPRTVAHSWYQHAINEAAALDKEEEIYKAQSNEIKNRCKYAAIPGVFRIKHEEVTMSYSIDRRRVNPVTPSLRANNNDPYLPVLTSEPSDISGLLLSSPPPISNSISSTERGFSILRGDTYNNNHVTNDLTDFLPRNNNLGLTDVNYEVDIMDDIDLLQNDDLSFI
ncbi:41_t:CDS:2 [Diversispora eburnea]|uniref:41_t:CDS:1 n=1 Tax=Diversispora eburnea TaxID=1213867 RepID=A0A9N8W4A3_9GLOM|nr:41_t:CDS:2 [Diversispora eburnea]